MYLRILDANLQITRFLAYFFAWSNAVAEFFAKYQLCKHVSVVKGVFLAGNKNQE